MPRTLDPDAAAQKDEAAPSPALVLRVDLPDPVGTRWFSDREIAVAGLDVEARIVRAGRILAELAAGRRPSVADTRFGCSYG